MVTLESDWQHLFVETNNIRLHTVTQGEGETRHTAAWIS